MSALPRVMCAAVPVELLKSSIGTGTNAALHTQHADWCVTGAVADRADLHDHLPALLGSLDTEAGHCLSPA